MWMDTYDLEKAFLQLDDNFTKIRDLKERYITFNQSVDDDAENLEKRLSNLIDEYKQCGIQMFDEFANLLSRYKVEILNSFVRIPKENAADKREDILRRLSNGPIEGFNRKPKDLKRNSRGFRNFDYTRNRILWSTRENAPVLAVPRSRESVHTYTGKNRGKYKK